MKINLIANNNNVRNGYINIDQHANPSDVRKISMLYDNLDGICDDGEATEIIADNIIQIFHGNTWQDTIQHWSKKLCHGGTLKILFTNLPELAKCVTNKNINDNDTNILLYGSETVKYSSTHSISRISQFLESIGLKIIMKRSQNLQAVVSAERV